VLLSFYFVFRFSFFVFFFFFFFFFVRLHNRNSYENKDICVEFGDERRRRHQSGHSPCSYSTCDEAKHRPSIGDYCVQKSIDMSKLDTNAKAYIQVQSSNANNRSSFVVRFVVELTHDRPAGAGRRASCARR
jgi:hypothetical protein